LKLSTWPFCIGLPGWMCSSVICLSSHQTIKCRLVNSGPLSGLSYSLLVTPALQG